MPNPVVQPGDLRLYLPGPDLTSAVIDLGEATAGIDAKYVHVGIVVDPTTEVAAYQTGVQIGGLLNQACDILRPEHLSSRAIATGLAWAQGKAGKTPYGYLDLVYLWILRRFKVKGPAYPQSQMICSMLAAGYLRQAGLDPWPGLASCEIAPGDFDGAKGLTNIGRWAPVVPARA